MKCSRWPDIIIKTRCWGEYSRMVGSTACRGQKTVVLLLLREFLDEDFQQCGLSRARIPFKDKHMVWWVGDESQDLLQHILLASGQLDFWCLTFLHTFLHTFRYHLGCPFSILQFPNGRLCQVPLVSVCLVLAVSLIAILHHQAKCQMLLPI